MGAEAAGHAAVTLAKRPVPPRGTPGEARERRCAGVRAPKENQRDSVRNAMNRGVSAHGSTHGTGTDEPRCAMPAPDRALAEGIRRAPVPPRGTPTLQWKHKVAVATCSSPISTPGSWHRRPPDGLGGLYGSPLVVMKEAGLSRVIPITKSSISSARTMTSCGPPIGMPSDAPAP
jgi:hypothetical protein